MAREFGKLLFSLMTDDDFTRLAVFDKLLYCALVGQPAVNHAGVWPVNWRRIQKAMRDGDRHVSVTEVHGGLTRLESARFVFLDEDTGELLIRSHIRNDGVVKQPNTLIGGLRAALQVESPKLRAVLRSEVARLLLPMTKNEKIARALSDLHSECLRVLPEGFGEGFAEGFREGFGEPLEDSDNQPQIEGFPEPFAEGFGEPPVVVAVAVVSPPVGGDLCVRANDETESAAVPAAGSGDGHTETEPPVRCAKHRDAETGEPCGPCANFRKAHDRWDGRRVEAEKSAVSAAAHARAAAAAAAIAGCGLCDDDGRIHGGSVCDHVDRRATNARGMAGVRAELEAIAARKTA